MKISVVTISYNQARFLDACLASVARQKDENVEFIVVDAGSTDGSRELLERRRDCIDQLILEPDEGPADGLNKGFSHATGDIFYYLNSDDVVLGRAFEQARQIFLDDPDVSVVAGAGLFLDVNGKPTRRVWSDPVGRLRLAYGGGTLIQPATFIRAGEFRRVSGFNKANLSNWDGELITDLYLAGAKFKVVKSVWGGYRLHDESITSSAKLIDEIQLWSDRRYQKFGMNHSSILRTAMSNFFRIERIVRHPRLIYDRLRYGPVFGQAAK